MGTVLVTGAGGYIGSVLVPKLLRAGYRVTAIDRFFFGSDTLPEHSNLRIIREDTRRLDESYFEDVEAVVDLVAISNDPSGELFQDETYQINYLSRLNTARLAKKAGVKRYILPSSCSIYGFQEDGQIVDEESKTNSLTTYAKANERAEQEILPLADEDFTVTVMRQATVYGYSPRMRFDLVVNLMTYGAWKSGIITLNRDGKQWRPFVHIQDTTDVICLLLQADPSKINGQIFNVGSNRNNYQMERLANEIALAVPIQVRIEWVGEPDHRSYQVDCGKIERELGWRAQWSITDGVHEIYDRLFTGSLAMNDQTITLKWYQELSKWHRIIKETEMYGGIIQL